MIWHEIITYLISFYHYFYIPARGPFYEGNIWGNVFVVVVVVPLAWLWSRTKFWPLRPIKNGFIKLHERFDELHLRHDKHDEHLVALTKSLEDLHAKHDSLHARLDHHDSEFAAIKASLNPEMPLSPSE